MNDLSNKRCVRQFKDATTLDSIRFAEADSNGDQRLDFNEFLHMLPPRIHSQYSVDQVQAWFDAADTNGDGTLSTDEFFRWSLTNAARTHGSRALELIFAKYDRDGTGQLDVIEFQEVVEQLGFYGVMAKQIFNALDVDNSGFISYHELIDKLSTGAVTVDESAKKLLTSMVWTYGESESSAPLKAIDTKGWVIRGQNADSVRHQLQELLDASGGHVIDLIKLFDIDAGMALTIDDVEFATAMRCHFGYRGSKLVLDEVFASLDTDGSGKIGFHELFEFLRGRASPSFHEPISNLHSPRSPCSPCRQDPLQMPARAGPSHGRSCSARNVADRHSLDPRSAPAAVDMSVAPPAGRAFDHVAWSAASLHSALQQMMSRQAIGPAEVLTEAMLESGPGAANPKGRSSRRSLSLDAWLNFIFGSAFGGRVCTTLWDDELKPAATAAFNQMLALVKGVKFDSKNVGIVQLTQWLTKPRVHHTSNDLPRKSSRALEGLHAKRRERDALLQLPAAGAARRKRTADTISARATAAISNAAMAAAQRDAAAKKEEEARALQWHRSRGCQVNGQRWERPPVQRWESPPCIEAQLATGLFAMRSPRFPDATRVQAGKEVNTEALIKGHSHMFRAPADATSAPKAVSPRLKLSPRLRLPELLNATYAQPPLGDAASMPKRSPRTGTKLRDTLYMWEPPEVSASPPPEPLPMPPRTPLWKITRADPDAMKQPMAAGPRRADDQQPVAQSSALVPLKEEEQAASHQELVNEEDPQTPAAGAGPFVPFIAAEPQSKPPREVATIAEEPNSATSAPAAPMLLETQPHEPTPDTAGAVANATTEVMATAEDVPASAKEVSAVVETAATAAQTAVVAAEVAVTDGPAGIEETVVAERTATEITVGETNVEEAEDEAVDTEADHESVAEEVERVGEVAAGEMTAEVANAEGDAGDETAAEAAAEEVAAEAEAVENMAAEPVAEEGAVESVAEEVAAEATAEQAEVEAIT